MGFIHQRYIVFPMPTFFPVKTLNGFSPPSPFFLPSGFNLLCLNVGGIVAFSFYFRETYRSGGNSVIFKKIDFSYKTFLERVLGCGLFVRGSLRAVSFQEP